MNLSLEAPRGKEFWGINDKDLMEPPDVPKKLRGQTQRIKKEGRLGGGNQTKTLFTQNYQVQVQNTPEDPVKMKIDASKREEFYFLVPLDNFRVHYIL